MKPIIAIPAILFLVHRAYSRKSLTPLGITFAALTAIAHAIHPWSAPFALLGVFYLAGTKVTKVKHNIKARLTLSASGSDGGEGQRTHIQVLANSVVASVLILLHARLLAIEDGGSCFAYGFGQRSADLLVVGIVANYAAVAADTFSSELGILSKSNPRLITSLTLRRVPPGTNGGVTTTGLVAGLGGAFAIAVTSAALLPFCSSNDHNGSGVGIDWKERAQFILAVTIWGGLGSLLDSVLGGLLQASVVDRRTGKIVEGTGGQKVLIHPYSAGPEGMAEGSSSGLSADAVDEVRLRSTEAVANAATLKETSVGESRRVENGYDLLDNNAVNLLMAAMMSLGAMGAAGWAWDVPVQLL